MEDTVDGRSTGPLTKTIDDPRAKGVTVTSEPRSLPLPNGPAINFAYMAGDAGRASQLRCHGDYGS